MTPIKIKLPEVKASGRREGWWFHVTGTTTSRKAGFAGFTGEQLTAGECDLPPMAVVLLARPVGSARLDARAVDLMTVSPASNQLVGVAYGFEWHAGASYDQLRMSVFSALQAQASYNDTDRKLEDLLTGWIGQGHTEGFKTRAAKEIENILKLSVPKVTDVRVADARGNDTMSVEFSLPTKDATRLIRCAVPGYGPDGDEEFAFLVVRVPLGYIAFDEDPDSTAPHHAAAARKAAVDLLGMEVAADAPVYDDATSDHWEPLLGMFYWESALLCELEGGHP